MGRVLVPIRSTMLYAQVGAPGNSLDLPKIPSIDRAVAFDAFTVTPIVLSAGPASAHFGAGDSQVDFVVHTLKHDNEDLPAWDNATGAARVQPDGVILRGMNTDSSVSTELTVGQTALTCVTGPGVLVRRPGKGVALGTVPPIAGGSIAGRVGFCIVVITYFREDDDSAGATAQGGSSSSSARNSFGGGDAFSGADGLGGIAGALTPRGQFH